jgi:hypothetical protein
MDLAVRATTTTAGAFGLPGNIYSIFSYLNILVRVVAASLAFVVFTIFTQYVLFLAQGRCSAAYTLVFTLIQAVIIGVTISEPFTWR